MRTQSEIEAAVCDGMGQFEQEFMGRGPKSVQAHLVRDLIVVRLQGILTAAEQKLVTSVSRAHGRDLVKQMRAELMDTARPLIQTMIGEIASVPVISLNHDINLDSNEQIVVFILASPPAVRETKGS